LILLSKLLQTKTATILWFCVTPIVIIKHFFLSSLHNNYFIYKYTFYHALNSQSLFGYYPSEYFDKNHYGPIFSIFMAPYALLPDWAGYPLWVATLVTFLFLVIKKLPLADWQKNGILFICLNEVLTASFNVQFSVMIAALIALTFILINNEKDFLAPLPMLIGAFVKLYGIVGLAFFFFVKDKRKFILGCIFWSVILFVLPMIISSPGYVIDMYEAWYSDLVIKNSENVSLTSHQDFSVMGFVRRMLQDSTVPNWPFLGAGILLFGLPYLRIRQYQDKAYQLLLLSSVLMFPILFSSASEGPTYIIPFLGIAIWFVIQPSPRPRYVWILLLLAFLFASLNSTDIYPLSYRIFLREHSVKVIPCLVIWVGIIYEMMTRSFSRYETRKSKNTPES
jgi:hypothetical protein